VAKKSDPKLIEGQMSEAISTIPTSISELIERWKSIAEFAADVGCGYEAARKMRSRESIDVTHWESVIKAAESKGVPGIDWEWLGRTHSLQKA
jgi:hypothetical protein